MSTSDSRTVYHNRQLSVSISPTQAKSLLVSCFLGQVGTVTDCFLCIVSIDPGVILIGEPGDNVANRPAWAKDSSFLAFRKLRQFVPEFNTFLNQNPIPDPNLTPAQGSVLLGPYAYRSISALDL